MQQVVKKPSHQGKRLNRVTIKRPQAGCAQAYAPGWGIAYVKGNDGDCRETPVTLSELFRSTLLLQSLKVQLGEWRWILGQCLGEAAAAGRNSVGGTKEHSTVLRVQSD
jgi:hypothetical protein